MSRVAISDTDGRRQRRPFAFARFFARAIARAPGVRYCPAPMRFSRQMAALAAVFWMLAVGTARAAPESVGASISLTGASTTAVYAAGVGSEQLLVVADAALNRLVMVEVRTGLEVGTALALATGCVPLDLLPVGSTLYVACSGSDQVELVDLSSLALPSPSLSSLGTVAVGMGPDRLLQVQGISDDYLIVQNATGNTASVISLSSVNAPIGINADDSTEVPDTVTAPVPVRLCGQDASAGNRSMPIGLGAGFERIYAACDDGLLSWFDPFNNMDFSVSADLNVIGSAVLTAAQGRAGVHGFFLQAADGMFYAIDVSEAETGGSAEAQALYFDSEARYTAAGPTVPRGLLTFFDPETSSEWLALLGNPAGAQVDIFDVGDLSDEPYVPNPSRNADAQFSIGLSAIGGQPVRADFGGGNLFVPTRGPGVSVIYGGPVPTFDSPDAPFMISSLEDPGLGGYCTAGFPETALSVTWNATENVATDGCAMTLTSSNGTQALECMFGSASGLAEIARSDILALDGLSEDLTVDIELLDDAGNAAFGSESILLDGGRPTLPTTLTGSTANGTLYLNWGGATDPGTPASGVRDYVLEIIRNVGTADEAHIYVTGVTGTSFSGTLESLGEEITPLIPGEIIWVSISTCDNAGNRSAELLAPVRISQALIGLAARFGEEGGCALSARGGNALAPFLLVVGVLGLLRLLRRRTR